jgi:hypothetical protein
MTQEFYKCGFLTKECMQTLTGLDTGVSAA